jgi:predicted amidohydrolase YtcJ
MTKEGIFVLVQDRNTALLACLSQIRNALGFSARPRVVATAFASVALTVCGAAAWAQDSADTIYRGGPILTMYDAAPRAEGIAVKDGNILAVGNLSEVMKHRGDATKIVELDGRAMVPGFVDSHGHVIMGGVQSLSANLLAPPDGRVTDIPGLQNELRSWISKNKKTVDRVKLIIGFGYDQSQLSELRHPTRDDLDAVSTTVPIFIVHQSGHLGVANSKALESAGVTSASKDPSGGVIRRRADGEPNGVLEESAHFEALGKLLGSLGPEAIPAFAKAGADLWTRFGYTTAQEGRAVPSIVEAAKKLASQGKFKIDIVAYPDVLVDRDYISKNVSRDYKNRLRVGGAKLTIDGSPQGFTAWRDRPYFDPVGEYPPAYVGYAAVTSEQVIGAVDWAYKNNIQLLTHSNGEAASDLLISAVGQAARKHGNIDRRMVLIHGQFLREDQVDALNRLKIFPSLFPMHTFYWGDWHRDHTVGPVRAENISPTGWLRKRGMIFGTHHDAPVAFPDSMRVLDATVTRRSRSGDILGPAQRVDVMTALKAMTIWPAWQHFEEDKKGTIQVGKLADFVVLSKDPTAIDPETLDKLRVLVTIKEDTVIYAAEAVSNRGALETNTKFAGTRPYDSPRFGHAFLYVVSEAMRRIGEAGTTRLQHNN